MLGVKYFKVQEIKCTQYARREEGLITIVEINLRDVMLLKYLTVIVYAKK